MVQQIHNHGITNDAVLKSMNETQRHEFVPERLRPLSYRDGALPIGHEQTISQPYMVASMAQEAKLTPDSKVLEVGTGCGYAAAVFAKVAKEVYSVEIIPELAEAASTRLKNLGYENIHVSLSNGSLGLPQQAPYDAIIVAASAPHVPAQLKEQLAVGGRMLIPVHDPRGGYDKLMRVTRESEDAYSEEALTEVRFVPLTGEQGWNGFGEKPEVSGWTLP